MDATTPLTWGLDIGATTGRLVAARGFGPGAIIAREDFSLTKQPDGDFEKDFDNLRAACERMQAREHGAVEGIGLAVAGKVSDDRTHITAAGNLGHWVNQPVAQMLRDELDCPVALGNDAEVAGMAEALYGHGSNEDFWFIIWGSGVGGCLVRHHDGKPVIYPGEVGHQLVSPHAMRKCGCGQTGCLEAYCGGDALARHHRKSTASLSTSEWQNVAEWMSIGVHALSVVQLVPLVVFGGGVANKQPQLIDSVARELKKSLHIRTMPKLLPSALGEDTGVVGALELLRSTV